MGIKDSGQNPLVSFVIPMLNEAEHIQICMDSILDQDYPKDKIEMHVVDGGSTDGSVPIVKDYVKTSVTPIFLHNNPKRKTPISLNIGIKAALGELIIILGAHTEIEPDFVIQNVANLNRDGVWCSGGTQINVGKTLQQSSIGVAMSHWFGIPSAAYRYKKKAGFVNTVVYGAYKKEVFNEVGLFEEKGLMSEDAELNLRIINAGYKIYYDPRIKSRYYPRKTLITFFKQMYNYGILRSQILKKHSRGLRWLHFVPPLSLVFFLLLAISSIVVQSSIVILAIFMLLYLTMAGMSAVDACIRQGKGNPVLVFIAFIDMHIAWALGFWAGMIRPKSQF
ncbi:MAG: glycosyltransferase family 2 protein [Candidatus Marinimicrobia bacterium]|nr:glycosyltransferase family 2 protein [Candidatus Neomarinimicrobiota bacterium]